MLRGFKYLLQSRYQIICREWKSHDIPRCLSYRYRLYICIFSKDCFWISRFANLLSWHIKGIIFFGEQLSWSLISVCTTSAVSKLFGILVNKHIKWRTIPIVTRVKIFITLLRPRPFMVDWKSLCTFVYASMHANKRHQHVYPAYCGRNTDSHLDSIHFRCWSIRRLC